MNELSVDPAVAALILGCAALLFAVAAAHKFRDLPRFDAIFAAYAVLPRLSRLGVSRVVPIVEACVAAGLLFTVVRVTAGAVGIVLLCVYSGAIALNLARGRTDIACGCGGPDDRRPIAAWMIWRNLIFALLLMAAMLPRNTRTLGLTDAVTVGFGTATFALVYLCFEQLLGRTGRLTADLRVVR